MAIPSHPRRAEAEALLRAGSKVPAVARLVGASLAAVRRWRAVLGLPPGKRGAGDGQLSPLAAEVLHRLDRGDRPSQIAADLAAEGQAIWGVPFSVTAARIRQVRALVSDDD